jgi:hypothetical protein
MKDKSKCNTWQGPGWYAPRQEYQPHSGEWETVFYFIDDCDELPDDRDSVGLGTPSWFDMEEEMEV